MLHALGWCPGRPVALSIISGSVLAVPDDVADVAVSADGHLRLPVGLRRRCGLSTGDRVLLVADPPAGRLLIHPVGFQNSA
ncbi:MAG: AbrB/MazE/SpoVT family DNA-binding domain-containing protein [Pseudonocardia sp.]|nr:AbrB/MazE/SpoVT family DNA-binding domain-containing protein [Pseudonocardia sp.]